MKTTTAPMPARERQAPFFAAYRARCVDCGADAHEAGPRGLMRHSGKPPFAPQASREPLWFCVEDAACVERCWQRYGGVLRAYCELRDALRDTRTTTRPHGQHEQQEQQDSHEPRRWRVVATDGRSFTGWLYRQVERAEAEQLAAMLNCQQSGVTYFVEADDDEDA